MAKHWKTTKSRVHNDHVSDRRWSGILGKLADLMRVKLGGFPLPSFVACAICTNSTLCTGAGSRTTSAAAEKYAGGARERSRVCTVDILPGEGAQKPFPAVMVDRRWKCT